MYTKTQKLFFLVFVIFNSFHSINSNPDSYSLSLACGSENGGNDPNGRKWESDSKYIASGTNSNSVRAQFQDPSLPSDVPYMTSRMFTSKATYNFPVKADNRYFLRFYFYPAVYGSNNAEEAYFSVLANDITLLKNFSASLTCKALTQAYIIKEYSLALISSGSLSVTFEPGVGFAYVNGIELVLMPEIFDTVTVLGFSDQTVEAKTSNMQTMYRLNIGGQFIPPGNDSGLSRTWYDYFPYIYGAGFGVTNQATPDVKIDYKGVRTYVAPVDVYSDN